MIRLNKQIRMLRPSYKHTPMRARMIETHGCQWLNLQITTRTLQQPHCLPSSWTMDFTCKWALDRIQHHMKRLGNVYRHEVLGNWLQRWMRYLHSQSNILQRLRKQYWDRQTSIERMLTMKSETWCSWTQGTLKLNNCWRNWTIRCLSHSRLWSK